jgi:hypothetical protein
VPKVPESAPKVPDSAPKVPDSAPKVPESAPKVPENAPKVPENAPKVPERVYGKGAHRATSRESGLLHLEALFDLTGSVKLRPRRMRVTEDGGKNKGKKKNIEKGEKVKKYTYI